MEKQALRIAACRARGVLLERTRILRGRVQDLLYVTGLTPCRRCSSGQSVVRLSPCSTKLKYSVKASNDFELLDGGIAVGPSVGFYRIAVEYLAVVAACLSQRFYLPTKGAAAVLLYSVKWLDPLLLSSPQADRIAGGYFVVMRKPAAN